MNTEQCVVCEEEKHVGIHLLDKFICEDCQRNMIETEADDPMYIYYINKLKNIKIPTTI